MCQNGGFLIAPSGTCFSRLQHNSEYRDAVTHADVAIPDSGAMVLLWKFLRGRKLTRISGLRYLQRLSARLFVEKPKVLWVVPNETAREKNTKWLSANHFTFGKTDFYIAPWYSPKVEDEELVA